MDLYPELFISKWTLIALIFTVLACIGLIISKYTKQQIIKTTIRVAIISYLVVTIPVGIITYQTNFHERDMIKELNRIHEEKGEDYILFVKYYTDSDSDEVDVRVYSGNYSEDETFKGSISVKIEDGDKKTIQDETYEDINLKPGEKLELDSFSTEKTPGMFYYLFNKEN